MKTLIDAAAVSSLVNEGKKTLCIDSDTVITPSAKDLLKANSIEVIIGSKPCEPPAAVIEAGSTGGGMDVDLLYKLFSRLQAAGMFSGKTESSDKPYVYERDKSGFKVVRGHSVCTTTLETGNPADNGKVQYQEIIGSCDASPVNAGFMTIESCSFDWDVAVHEVYYVVSGRITVTIDGNVYEAAPGDSLYIPKGSKCIFGAKENVKVFYVTY